MKKIVPIIIGSATGLTIVAGYFFQARLAPVLGLLMHWGIALVGLAGLIGIGYLVKTHMTRILHKQKSAFYSVVVLVAFLFTVGAGLFLSMENSFYRDWVLNIQIPVETSLLAILSVTLLSASLAIFRTRGWTPMSVGFLVSALISLILNLRYVQTQPESLGEELLHLVQRLPLAGMRGILIGMGLGGLIVGLRVLLAFDRPYGGD